MFKKGKINKKEPKKKPPHKQPEEAKVLTVFAQVRRAVYKKEGFRSVYSRQKTNNYRIQRARSFKTAVSGAKLTGLTGAKNGGIETTLFNFC